MDKILLKSKPRDDENMYGLFVWKTETYGINTEFVVWTYPNGKESETIWGHYFDSLDNALEYFNVCTDWTLEPCA